MVRSVWASLQVSVALFFSGCTCNNTEYSFPYEEPPPVDPDVPGSYGSWLSFDTSPEGGRLTMSYYDRERKALGWAVGVPGDDGTVSWHHEKVDGYPDNSGLDLRDAGKYSSQRTAPDGTVWIAYQDVGVGALRIAHRTGPDTWAEPETVDGGSAAASVGNWASLALDKDGLPVVAHCDNAAGAVRVSRFDGTSWRSIQAYASKPVDVTDDQGAVITRPAGVAYTDLVIQGDDLWIAVYDSASTSLHLLHGSGDTFEDEVVDDDGDVGAWPSVWTDGSKTWIAYQDVGREDLMFASREGDAPWSRERVDDGEMRGADTALFEQDGEPRIVYFDGMDNDQWLATRADGRWETAQIGGADGAVGYHNEAVRVGGAWWVGSFNYTTNMLFVQRL